MIETAERLQRIAQAHRLWAETGTEDDGRCIECDWTWPCPTYRWATDPELNPATDDWTTRSVPHV